MNSADNIQDEIISAAQVLAKGGLIAYPTEGVWGLGCDPSNQHAVNRLLELKSRAVEKGLILVADQITRLGPFIANLPHESDLDSQSGRPITWILEHGGNCPAWLSGGRPGLAIRITNHPVIQAICSQADMPLVSTSANPASAVPAMSQEEVMSYFGNLIDVIVPGDLGGENGASEIRDYKSGKVIRESST